MFKGTVLCLPRSDAIRHAAMYLSEAGIPVTEKCGPDVTHLLLPVPSFPAGDTFLAYYLGRLPDDLIVTGGNLDSPLLAGYTVVDFLRDPYYLATNAAITADCAMELVREHFPGNAKKASALIIGWGRIGKCLAKLLDQAGAKVGISARNPRDLAMLQALGYEAIPISELAVVSNRFDMVLNTVPEMVLPNPQLKSGCLAMELASKPGIGGDGILSARGLPGRMAPQRSGKLIADTFIRLTI